jgi:hypothetical protein
MHCVLSVIRRSRESCENLPHPSLRDTLPKFCEFREGCAAEGQRAAGVPVRERGRVVRAAPFGALRGAVRAAPFGALRGAVRAGVHCVLSVIRRLEENYDSAHTVTARKKQRVT